MPKHWKRLSEETVLGLPIFALKRERFVSPRTAAPLDAVVLETADWVNVVALTETDDVVMIRQFRFGSEAVTLEIPGGIVDPGESPRTAVERELREETGFVAQRITSLGAIAPNPAFMRNRLHIFVAEGCSLAAEQALDPGEDIEVLLQPLREVDAMVAAGAIDHALVEVAFHRLRLHRAGHGFS
ncbi:MAG: NUDIX hydrolase [Myxococcales bacterium]|nr:NUDIX hydrolase [Myxococcales bacterium]